MVKVEVLFHEEDKSTVQININLFSSREKKKHSWNKNVKNDLPSMQLSSLGAKHTSSIPFVSSNVGELPNTSS